MKLKKDIIGMQKEDAIEYLKENNYPFRIVKEDFEKFPINMSGEKKVNLEIFHNIVTNWTIH